MLRRSLVVITLVLTACGEASSSVNSEALPIVVDTESSFVEAGNDLTLLKVADPDRVVVLLHGHPSSPASMRSIGDRIAQDGATVVIPKINTSSELEMFDTQAAETACAIGFAASLAPDKPLLVLGFSMGGLLAGQYVASPGLLADPSLCPGVDAAAPVDGIVLLDGPVWLEGFAEARGRTSEDVALLESFDPIAIAVTQPQLRTHYFVSRELPDYSTRAVEMFDVALGVEGKVDRLDSSHIGLIDQNPDVYAKAVLDLVSR